jgi:hypothetical protein
MDNAVLPVSDNAENGLDVIQRSNLMVNADNFVIWIPERSGHAPPFWQDGMLWCLPANYPKLYDKLGSSIWEEGRQYCVPPEAVNGPFDVQAWLAEGHANADKLPAGVVLPEPTDWADTLAAEILEMYVDVSAHVVNAEVAKLIRTHCQTREVYNAPGLLDVANKAFDFLGGVDDAAEIRAELLSAIAKATKP